MGTTKVKTGFVKSKSEFSLSVEPKLQLETDVDFSNGASLCMRLSQPDCVFKHEMYKTESIPAGGDQSKHSLKRWKFTKSSIPGKTYALNKKNSDMCNAIFNY